MQKKILIVITGSIASYKALYLIRKVKDKIALNVPTSDVTYETRLDFAKLSRQGLNNSGSKLLEFDESVKVEKLQGTPVDIYKFTHKIAQKILMVFISMGVVITLEV